MHRYRLNDHANYQLKLKQTLTIKPDGFTLGVARRTAGERAAPVAVVDPVARHDLGRRRAPGTALIIFHGSNLGTCAGIARDLADRGSDYGFTSTVAPSTTPWPR